MTSFVTQHRSRVSETSWRWGPLAATAFCATVLAGCASQPSHYAFNSSRGRGYDPRLGVYASPRLVDDGQPVPRGGGTYLVGRPYTIAGRAFYPNEHPEGYVAVGTASWYGDAFHGRRTANGEIFDKNSISAAHPTLPLPSYVRVTNTGNGRSMIVRVNDRGPYHGGRVMDVSQRVAEALSFKGQGTARVRIEYVGRASLGGSDDGKLLATLRDDGAPAQLNGEPGVPTMLADDQPPVDPTPAPQAPRPAAQVERVARAEQDADTLDMALPPPPRRRSPAPVPPLRPYDFDPESAEPAPLPGQRAGLDRLIRTRVAVAPRRTAPVVTFAVTKPYAAE
jgi:rare lipoprotein A